jgi:predicted transcriptional regulator
MQYKAKSLTEKVFHIIKDKWPIHASGVCRVLEIEPNSSNVSKIKYHFELLKKQNKIHTKKLDRALVAWPVEIERLRVMHELLRDQN